MIKKIIILAVIVTPVAFVGWLFAINITSEVALMDRFPDIPKDVVIRASRAMFWDSLKGKNPDVTYSEENIEEFDALFLSYVDKIQSK